MRAYPGNVGSCAAKHGVRWVARVVREGTGDERLRVPTVIPGATHTPTWDGVDLPEDRFMPPEDVAQSVGDAYDVTDRTVLEERLPRAQAGDAR